MATKINRTVKINGVKKWIHANTEQEYADKLIILAGVADVKTDTNKKHNFKKYADNWYEVFSKPKPFSYQQVKRMCERVKADTGFDENITPIRFRTTVLTDIYEVTKDVKAAQAAAGHTTSTMTLERYVKGRGTSSQTAAAIDQLYRS